MRGFRKVADDVLGADRGALAAGITFFAMDDGEAHSHFDGFLLAGFHALGASDAPDIAHQPYEFAALRIGTRHENCLVFRNDLEEVFRAAFHADTAARAFPGIYTGHANFVNLDRIEEASSHAIVQSKAAEFASQVPSGNEAGSRTGLDSVIDETSLRDLATGAVQEGDFFSPVGDLLSEKLGDPSGALA